jgi:hypothetical protein
MNDLAEFDPLDLAVLDNTAKQQKNKIGYQRLKQGASQGKAPIEVATSLYDERDKAAQELAAREVETEGFQNLYASINDDVESMMGFEQPQTPGLQPPSQFEVGLSNYVGAPSGSASNLGYPQVPQTQNAPGSYTTALNTQLGAEKSDLYNIKRGYASDTGYNNAMAAVREALGKAPAVPTLQKPQLTQEDQALVALAGIFGGFQNMPRALQGALAGAQQRAEIENQQLQNKYQQEQTAYQRQLQGLQNVAETEAERRKQEQETLDRIYQQAINTAQGRISRTEAQLANAPIKEAQLANRAEQLAMQRANAAQSAEQDAAKQAWQQSKSMLDKDFAEWTRLLKSKEKKEYITKADYDGLMYKRGELIKKYASLGNVGSLFYIPQIGDTDTKMGETARAAYDYGIKTGRAIAKDISGSLFGGGDVTPFATETSQRLQTLIDNYNKEQKKIQPLTQKITDLDAQMRQAKSVYDRSTDPADKKKYLAEFNKAYDAYRALVRKQKTMSRSFNMAKAALEAEYKNLGLGDPFAQKPGGQNPGKKTSVNVVDTPLGTIEFLDA